MDLRLTATVPATEEERAAIASVLGPPESGWEGGPRRGEDAHAAFGGHAARARHHLLITVLHALQERVGWISPGALDHISERLDLAPAVAFGVASFYALFRTEPSPGAVVHVCDDVACAVNGAERALRGDDPPVRRRGDRDRLQRRGRHLAAVPVPGPVRPRLGRAHPAGRRRPRPPRPRPRHPRAPLGGAHRTSRRSRSVIPNGPCPPPGPSTRLSRRRPGLAAAPGRPGRPRLARLLPGGGRLPDAPPRVRTRPAGRRPRGPRRQADGPRRGGVPHRDQMGRRRGQPGPPALRGLQRRRIGARHLQGPGADGGGPVRRDRGDDDHGLRRQRGPGLHLHPRRVPAGRGPRWRTRSPRPGRTACSGRRHGRGPRVRHRAAARRRRVHRGEETALFNSIEGKRAEPRNKPPFPAQSGLFGKPTAINNVETLLSVPPMLRVGGAAFASVGTEASTGPKLFCLSGCVAVAGRVRVRFRHHARRLDRRGGRGPRRHGRCRRCCSAAPRACSSGRTSWTCR